MRGPTIVLVDRDGVPALVQRTVIGTDGRLSLSVRALTTRRAYRVTVVSTDRLVTAGGFVKLV